MASTPADPDMDDPGMQRVRSVMSRLEDDDFERFDPPRRPLGPDLGTGRAGARTDWSSSTGSMPTMSCSGPETVGSTSRGTTTPPIWSTWRRAAPCGATSTATRSAICGVRWSSGFAAS